MFVVSDDEMKAVWCAYDRDGIEAAILEVRRRFKLLDLRQARDTVERIVRWPRPAAG